jgi:uncharacterized protein YceH (UPF0502 family)
MQLFIKSREQVKAAVVAKAALSDTTGKATDLSTKVLALEKKVAELETRLFALEKPSGKVQ